MIYVVEKKNYFIINYFNFKKITNSVRYIALWNKTVK